jgi:DNA-binding NtrC family response regulator
VNLARKRVLFVDDERGIRETLPPILRRYGFIVTAAATVADAIHEIHSKEFDLLLCDLNIERESDGLDVVREIRKINPDCVVIILTGYPAMDTAMEATRLGADDYVAKPASADTLVAIIAERLHGSRTRARVSPVQPTSPEIVTEQPIEESEDNQQL